MGLNGGDDLGRPRRPANGDAVQGGVPMYDAGVRLGKVAKLMTTAPANLPSASVRKLGQASFSRF